MADNLILNEGSGGSTLATAEVTHSGDTADVQIIGVGLMSGSAESYVMTFAIAGAGAVGLGVQRMTLASDDPAVVSLAIIDDWDESDRAKVNIIAGQAGIAAGTGVDGVTVPRFTLATDVGLPAGTAVIGAITTVSTVTNLAQIGGQAVAMGTGTRSAGTQRVTIATNDSVPVTGAFFPGTQPISGTVTANAGTGFGSIAVVGGGTEATALRVTLANDSTGTITVDTGGTAGLEVVQATAADLNMTEASAAAIKTAVEVIDNSIAVLGTDTYSEATTSGTIAGVVRNDVLAPLANTDNEIAPLQVDELGALWTTPSPNVVDDGNSRTANLTGGATFTGTGVDTLGFAGITINLFSDQDGAANGMRFEFSSNNSNWTTSHRHDYTADSDREFQFTSLAQFFRLVFINGATPTGALRIQTILHRQTVPSTTIHRLDDSLAPDRSAQVVKASLMAQAAGSGNFVPINSTAAGNLKVAVEEFDASLAVTNAGTFVVQENGAALTALQLIDNTVVVLGTATYSEATTSGNVIGAVRNDDLATLADTDNEIAPLQVDNQGALYVNQAAAENKQASGVAVGGAPGTDDMIAAVVGKKILVTAMSLTATSTTTNSVFVDNVDNDLWANTANPIPLSMDADGDTIAGVVLQYNPSGWFKTDTENEAVTLNSSAAQDIAWSISWIETD